MWDAVRRAKSIGRFGWKLNQPTVEQQSAGAFVGDMGLTSSLFPKDECSPPAQSDCLVAPSGGSPELADGLLRSVVIYSHLLAVPARRHWNDSTVRKGAALFFQAKCDQCHTPTMQTGESSCWVLSKQTIHPYSDLLLHDMGAGLADGRPDYEATGSEWRTAPRWGIGLVHTVNRHTFFLHDGRARNLTEAVLWHDGEAKGSRDAFAAMTKVERDALVSFLESL